ncbi:MAG: TRAP-type mannitol/chloroaromatic compound transporter [Candidatus Entotheonella gemina]|uniref:TRAP-type mannitol/chloroaromatic compound transporter n=1 Tax=Candidatus Entotheonella gemina TaxID=1429439 RepID=W4M3U1_9BACT|nr:MAG: TRAP-type mannitol/chloroaromatic compound transporter [Candidatus Entotheonella gemina]
MSERPEFSDELIAERRSDPPGVLPEDMPRWMAGPITWIDVFSLWTGRIVCWLTVPMFAAMVYEIIARYAFTAPTMWAYDMSRMLYGALFMLGSGYALSKGIHIRADFLYRSWSERTQGIVDAALYLCFYFPGLIVFTWMAIDFASDAWMRQERGMDTAWMPPVYPIKTVLPLGAALLLIQGVSEFLKSLYAAMRGRWPTQ